MIKYILVITSIAAVLLNTWDPSGTNAGTINTDDKHEAQRAENILYEIREIDKIEYKILHIRHRIDQELLHQISTSIYQNCTKTNKDPDMILAIMAVESYFNPEAKSPTGAQGLMQVMPLWTDTFGVNNFYDINTNIKYGIEILSKYEKMYKRYDLVLTAYNRGPDTVNKLLRQGINPRTGYSKAIIKTFNRLKRIKFDSTIYVATAQ